MWKQGCSACARLRGDGSGATVIEYAMIAALIGLVLMTLQASIGTSVVGFFTEVATGL